MNKNKEKKHPLLRKLLTIAFDICLIAAIILAASNLVVVLTTTNRVISPDNVNDIKANCIVVLGCGVWQNGEPSDMLADRLDCAIQLYNEGVADKIIMTGDNETEDYNETDVMKSYAVKKGVPSEDIYIDPYGLNTYDSVKRVKEVFCEDNIIIVTQKYHSYRAMYIADTLGINAIAVNSNPREYRGQIFRDIRELAARSKDMLQCLLGIPTRYISQPIDSTLSGDEVDLKKKK